MARTTAQDAGPSEEKVQVLSESLADVTLEGATPESAPLLALPEDLASLLLTFLDPLSRLHLSQTNKALRSYISPTHEDRVAALLYLETDPIYGGLEHTKPPKERISPSCPAYFACVGCMKLLPGSRFMYGEKDCVWMRKPARDWPATNPAHEPADPPTRWARRRRISAAVGDTSLGLWSPSVLRHNRACRRLLFGHAHYKLHSPPDLTPAEAITLLRWTTGHKRDSRMCRRCHARPPGYTPFPVSAKPRELVIEQCAEEYLQEFARAYPGSPMPLWPEWDSRKSLLYMTQHPKTKHYSLAFDRCLRHTPRARPWCTECTAWLDEHVGREDVTRWIRHGSLRGDTHVLRWRCTHTESNPGLIPQDATFLITWDLDLDIYDNCVGRYLVDGKLNE